MTMKKKKSRGFQIASILYYSEKMLEEMKKPLTYEELNKLAKNRNYKTKGSLSGPGVFRHRINEDIARRKGESIFQVVDFRTVGLKKWGFLGNRLLVDIAMRLPIIKMSRAQGRITHAHLSKPWKVANRFKRPIFIMTRITKNGSIRFHAIRLLKMAILSGPLNCLGT